jgi:hypothetical protein
MNLPGQRQQILSEGGCGEEREKDWSEHGGRGNRPLDDSFQVVMKTSADPLKSEFRLTDSERTTD